MKSLKAYVIERSNPDLSGIPIIQKELKKLEAVIIGKELLPNEFAKILKTIVKKGYKYITVQVIENTNIRDGEFGIKGEYDDQLFGKPAIWISLLVKDKKDSLKLNRDTYINFVNLFIDLIEHELVHQYQSAKRDYEPQDVGNKTYFNQEDEVDAYARDIAKELRRNYISKHQIPFNKPDTIKSNTLQYVLTNMDKYHIIKNRKRLLKRVIQYLEVL